MKIIQLTAENVKRLKVVDITPTDPLVQVTGRNGSGKTSVLDSIWWALAGEKVIQDEPIHHGAESGRIRLDLGDMVVERKFLQSGATSLIVRNKIGAEPGTPDRKLPKWDSPQELLKTLIGRMSFEPMQFAEANEREQFEQLKAVSELDVDIEALETENAADFRKRTDINRDAKTARARAEGIQVPVDLPALPIDESEFLNQMQSAAEHNAAIEQRKARREQAQRDANEKKAEGVRLRNESAKHRERATIRLSEMRLQMEEYERQAEERALEIDRQASEVLKSAADLEHKIDSAEPLPAPIDISTIRTSLESAKATNRAVAQREQRNALLKEAAELDAQSAALTKRMADREKQKLDAIANAKMPVQGLSLSGGKVYFNGSPFKQASDAERICVSVAIAMALNPRLRVIRIRQGSLLDNDMMALIGEMAADRDYQIWVERVDDSGEVGIVMEDGEVASTPQTRKKHQVEA